MEKATLQQALEAKGGVDLQNQCEQWKKEYLAKAQEVALLEQKLAAPDEAIETPGSGRGPTPTPSCVSLFGQSELVFEPDRRDIRDVRPERDTSQDAPARRADRVAS